MEELAGTAHQTELHLDRDAHRPEDIEQLRVDVADLTRRATVLEENFQICSEACELQVKLRNLAEQSLKDRMDALLVVLDTKVHVEPSEHFKKCTESLTQGVMKVVQVVGLYPSPRHLADGGTDQSEVGVKNLEWEKFARSLYSWAAGAWDQCGSQRRMPLLDIVAKLPEDIFQRKPDPRPDGPPPAVESDVLAKFERDFYDTLRGAGLSLAEARKTVQQVCHLPES